ncbi:glycine oxidase ThiO [Longirhabdus pacifica]|uniref:glycine oxidase ThiO n=1 Tax=Longirhabdus pacifica TaxID=2305227 RepID=UPI00100883B5|nr:glycine oxidase ThiO [Longirhabdus pacifica]
MKEQVDAIVIGGGVIGCSIAFYLAKKGKKVIVLERDRIACQASSAAAGMLTPLAELSEVSPLLQLAMESSKLFPGLAEELQQISGIDVQYVHRNGTLKVALNDEDEKKYKHIIEAYIQAGEEVAWLSGHEAREKEPQLSSAIQGAMYIPSESHISAPDLTKAFALSVRALGSEVREFAEVEQILMENNTAIGVQVGGERVYSDHVIVASGVWAQHVLSSSGLEAGLSPVKGECLSVYSDTPLVSSTIFTQGCYVVPKRGGRHIIGATMIEDSYDLRVSSSSITSLLERAMYMIPAIKDAKWEKTWAGLRPRTVDGQPYIGEHPDCAGLFIAAGHYRKGILLSAITGQLAAEWVEHRKVSSFSLAPFCVSR